MLNCCILQIWGPAWIVFQRTECGYKVISFQFRFQYAKFMSKKRIAMLKETA